MLCATAAHIRCLKQENNRWVSGRSCKPASVGPGGCGAHPPGPSTFKEKNSIKLMMAKIVRRPIGTTRQDSG